MCIINTGSNIDSIFYCKTYRIFCLSHLVAKFRFDFDNLNNFALVVMRNYKILYLYAMHINKYNISIKKDKENNHVVIAYNLADDDTYAHWACKWDLSIRPIYYMRAQKP